MPFAGYLVSIGRFNLLAAATAGALSCNLGSTVAYFVAAQGGRKAIERWGAYLLVGQTELDRTERFFSRHGAATVFIGRLLPLVRTYIALPAGIARMRVFKFQVYTFFGSWPWCFGLAYVGRVLGEHWNNDPTLRNSFHRVDAFVVVAFSVGLAWFIWVRRRNWLRSQR